MSNKKIITIPPLTKDAVEYLAYIFGTSAIFVEIFFIFKFKFR